MRQLAALIVLVAGAFGRFCHAAPLHLDAERECARVWRQKGFSSVAETGKNTLYRAGGESYDAFYKRLDRDNCWKEWLVVVYMAADNDLSPYSYRDVWEMEAIGSLVSMDAVVFLDSEPTDGMRYYHISKRQIETDYKERLARFVNENSLEEESAEIQEESFLKAQGQGLIQSPAVVRLPEGDSGETKTAGAFLEWAFERYPSRRVLLVGWSHGQGFDAKDSAVQLDAKAFGSDGKQGGFAFDYTSKSHMPAPEMAAGMKRLLNVYRQGKALDVAGSDACLNQQVEFGYEWLGVADYVFGSSTIVQKKGFNYRALFDWFRRRPGFPTDELAGELPAIYGRSVSKHAHGIYSSYEDRYATMATWAMPALVPLKRALDDLGGALLGWMQESSDPKTIRARRRAIQKQMSEVKTLGGVSYDLWNLLQHFESWTLESAKIAMGREALLLDRIRMELVNTSRVLTASVKNAFIGEAYQNGLLRTSKGVAIWLPASEDEANQMHPKFARGRFYQDETGTGVSPWGRFTQALYGN